jgi:hypothetical protein
VAQDGNAVTVINTSFNGSIPAGGDTSIGFVGNSAKQQRQPHPGQARSTAGPSASPNVTNVDFKSHAGRRRRQREHRVQAERNALHPVDKSPGPAR